MTTQITAETLSQITHNHIPVITTELLAVLYGTEPDYIRKNYSRNADRFVAGKHFFLLENKQLREFKYSMSLRPSVKIARNVRALILWTERGAARHAKMLETDQAWEVFEKLEDCYFNKAGIRAIPPASDLINFDIYQAVRDGKVAIVKHHQAGTLITVDEALALLRARGWLVMPKEELAVKIMDL